MLLFAFIISLVIAARMLRHSPALPGTSLLGHPKARWAFGPLIKMPRTGLLCRYSAQHSKITRQEGAKRKPGLVHVPGVECGVQRAVAAIPGWEPIDHCHNRILDRFGSFPTPNFPAASPPHRRWGPWHSIRNGLPCYPRTRRLEFRPAFNT